jgi:hypothetical protein
MVVISGDTFDARVAWIAARSPRAASGCNSFRTIAM